MKVLSFDPSSVDTGWAILEEKNTERGIKLIKSGSIKPDKSLDLGKRLLVLRKQITDVVKANYPIDVIVCEDQFSGKNAKTLMVLREFTAIIRLVATENELPFFLYPPATVKKAVTDNGKASKADVQKTVLEKYDPEEADNTNITDAIAVGLTHYKKQ